MSIKAIRIHKTGGPEVLQLDDVDLAPPAAGQVRVRNKAIGLNFVETYFRSGLYPAPLPSGKLFKYIRHWSRQRWFNFTNGPTHLSPRRQRVNASPLNWIRRCLWNAAWSWRCRKTVPASPGAFVAASCGWAKIHL